MRNAPSSGKGLWGSMQCSDCLGGWAVVSSAWSMLSTGSTNLVRSQKHMLLSPKQEEIMLTAEAEWNILCLYSCCWSRMCEEWKDSF